MNELVIMLNDAAAAWWPYVLHATWTSSVVAVVMLAVVRLCRRWPARVLYGIALIALLKFAMPPMMSAPVGIFNWLGPEVAWDAGAAAVSDSIAAGSLTAALGAVTWRGWLLVTHLLGAAATAAWFAAQLVNVARMSRTARLVTEGPWRGELSRLARQMGLRLPVRLLGTDRAMPPMAFGVLRRWVMVPASMLDDAPDDQARTILAHELAHHRRGDLWINWLQLVLTAVWWFNPLLWALNRVVRRTREDACDDLLLSTGVTTGETYCQTLLAAAKGLSRRARLGGVPGFAERLHPLAQRMTRIMDPKVHRSSRFCSVGFAMVVVLAGLVLPGLPSRIRMAPGEDEWVADVRPMDVELGLQAPHWAVDAMAPARAAAGIDDAPNRPTGVFAAGSPPAAIYRADAARVSPWILTYEMSASLLCLGSAGAGAEVAAAGRPLSVNALALVSAAAGGVPLLSGEAMSLADGGAEVLMLAGPATPIDDAFGGGREAKTDDDLPPAEQHAEDVPQRDPTAPEKAPAEQDAEDVPQRSPTAPQKAPEKAPQQIPQKAPQKAPDEQQYRRSQPAPQYAERKPIKRADEFRAWADKELLADAFWSPYLLQPIDAVATAEPIASVGIMTLADSIASPGVPFFGVNAFVSPTRSLEQTLTAINVDAGLTALASAEDVRSAIWNDAEAAGPVGWGELLVDAGPADAAGDATRDDRVGVLLAEASIDGAIGSLIADDAAAGDDHAMDVLASANLGTVDVMTPVDGRDDSLSLSPTGSLSATGVAELASTGSLVSTEDSMQAWLVALADTSVTSAAAPVPEPGAVGMLAMAAMAALCRRRRRA